jgi:predicted RNase H-like nuclease (RuvC/YqgF family)
MTTDKPYWEQDIAECLRVAAEIIGPNSYYLRAAEYIEEVRERLSSLQSECEERRKDAVNLSEKVIPNLRDRISKLEGSVNTLESECNQLNDMTIKQREQIDNLASMCRRLSYSVKRSGNDKLAHQCVELLKKYDLGGSVLRNMEGPAEVCPKPALGLEIDVRGVLVPIKDTNNG